MYLNYFLIGSFLIIVVIYLRLSTVREPFHEDHKMPNDLQETINKLNYELQQQNQNIQSLKKKDASLANQISEGDGNLKEQIENITYKTNNDQGGFYDQVTQVQRTTFDILKQLNEVKENQNNMSARMDDLDTEVENTMDLKLNVFKSDMERITDNMRNRVKDLSEKVADVSAPVNTLPNETTKKGNDMNEFIVTEQTSNQNGELTSHLGEQSDHLDGETAPKKHVMKPAVVDKPVKYNKLAKQNLKEMINLKQEELNDMNKKYNMIYEN
jgi:hypothetical protein